MLLAKKFLVAVTTACLIGAVGAIAVAQTTAEAATSTASTTEVITKYDSDRWYPGHHERRHERRRERRIARDLCLEGCYLKGHGRHHCEDKCL